MGVFRAFTPVISQITPPKITSAEASLFKIITAENLLESTVHV